MRGGRTNGRRNVGSKHPQTRSSRRWPTKMDGGKVIRISSSARPRHRAKMCRRLVEVFRVTLVVLLTAVFLWQTYMAFSKYIKGDTTITFKALYPDKQTFPSISFCAFSRTENDDPNDNDLEWTFREEEADMRKHEGFVAGFEHDVLEVMAVQDAMSDPGDLDDLQRRFLGSWSWQPSFDTQGSPNLTECLTYTAPQMYSGGKDSLLAVFINLTGVDQVTVFVHSPKQKLLVPTSLYGSSVFGLPKPREGESLHLEYKVTATQHTVMEREELPCHHEGDQHVITGRGAKGDDSKHGLLLDCIEASFESRHGCSLPWRANSTTQPRECDRPQHLRDFKQLYYSLADASPEDVYKETGCYYDCTYLAFETKLVKTELEKHGGDDDDDDDEDSPPPTSVAFFLSPGGVMSNNEVLAYDEYDLVGNVGGFLGLFLGFSILSLFDDARRKIGI